MVPSLQIKSRVNHSRKMWRKHGETSFKATAGWATCTLAVVLLSVLTHDSVCVYQGWSKKPLGGLSRETAEIEVGNSHQKTSKSGKVSTRATLQRDWRGVSAHCVYMCVRMCSRVFGTWFSLTRDGLEAWSCSRREGKGGKQQEE